MAVQAADVVKINWKQICPWLALFRTLGMALHVRQVCVGIVAALLITFAQSLLLGRPATAGFMFAPGGLDMLASSSWTPLADVVWPLVVPEFPFRLRPSGVSSWWELARFVISVVWAFVVGGLAGGILVRRAAFEFCREESLSLQNAIRFVFGRALDYLSAPALPLASVAGLGTLLILTGWIARSMPVGAYLISAVWGLVVVLALGMAVLLLLTIAAWPMMIAAVSINGGDGFDALSRGFGFVIDRWRYYACCALVMTFYGTLCVCLLQAVIKVADGLTTSQLLQTTGPVEIPLILPQHGWGLIVAMIGRGLAYSFFWSSMTVIYLVLRKSIDNAELNDMYVEGGPQEPDDLQALLNPQVAPGQVAPGPTLLPIIDQPT